MTVTENRTPVTLNEVANDLTLNGTCDVRRFDVRIDSTGKIHTLRVTDGKRDGRIIHSDTPMSRIRAEGDRGFAIQYYRNGFGALIRNMTRDGVNLIGQNAF